MRVIVTGAAGFIASTLIPRLLEEGHSVVGMDNLFLGRREYLSSSIQNERFEFIEHDLLDLDFVTHTFGSVRPEQVWHLAANSDISYGTRFTDFDLKGGTLVTYNVLEAMRRSGSREIVFSSSGAVYGEPSLMPTPEDYGPLFPISLYAASKLACEGLISAFAHNYDMRCWIFRFGNIVGPNPTHGAVYDFVLKLMRDRSQIEVLGDGNQSKPYVHVSDCVDGMMFGVSRSENEVNYFNLAPEGQTTVNNLLGWTLEEMSLDRDKVEVRYSGGARGWRGDVAQVLLDTTRMRTLGWKPRFTSDEAARRAVREIVGQLLSETGRKYSGREGS